MTFATFLSTVGFETIYNLTGGMEEYAQVIDPMVRKNSQ
jgi:rhodanese-related sulfurtransferase